MKFEKSQKNQQNEKKANVMKQYTLYSIMHLELKNVMLMEHFFKLNGKVLKNVPY